MKIIVAPDSFKGSLSALEICNIVEEVAKKEFLDVEVEKLPIADGGEGTVESVLVAMNGTATSVTVKNAIGVDINASYGLIKTADGQCEAIMEMAQASGLPLIAKQDRNIMQSNTYGTGQMVLDAINKGCKKIYMGLGGSATNDCGIGCANALGVVFLDESGNEVLPVPQNFYLIKDIDLSGVNPMLSEVEFIIMSDVKNPLVGEKGATYTFGRQKGASEDDLVVLEKGIQDYIKLVEKQLSVKVSDSQGSGAAGGLGAFFLAFTKAKMQSGVQTVLEMLKFEDKLDDTDLVITGEGNMDYQSAYGKVAYGVGQMCKKKGVSCVALVGGLGEKYEDMFTNGIDSMMCTVNRAMKLDDAIANSSKLCYTSIERMFKFIKIGMKIKK